MPIWQNPIPKFIKNQGGTTPEDLTYVAMFPLGSYANYTYTGLEGAQASAEEMIWSLPNGLQAYAIFGAWASVVSMRLRRSFAIRDFKDT